MEELKSIIVKHLSKYPKMEVIDIVKLVYQNEFGGGHMIRSYQVALDYLIKECDTILNNDEEEYVDIGNGLVRYNLSYLNNNKDKINHLNDIFIASSNKHKGTLSSFIKKLEMIRKMIEDNNLSISLKEFDEYMYIYEKEGYPMVSHSTQYKENYKPAYRVILKEYLKK